MPIKIKQQILTLIQLNLSYIINKIRMESQKDILLQNLLADQKNQLKDQRTFSKDEQSTFPLNSFGWIQFSEKLAPNAPKTFASGFLIAPNLVLTSSNPFIFCDAKNGDIRECQPASFNLLSAYKKGSRPETKSYKVEKVKINKDFVDRLKGWAMLANNHNEGNEQSKSQIKDQMANLNSQMILHDFALLKLTEPIERSQYFELFPGLTSNMSIAVTGFINLNGLFELSSSSITHSVDCGAILYNSGHLRQLSGSAVYTEGDSLKLVGIHQGLHADKDLSHASMITESMIDTLALWAQEMGARIPSFRKEQQIQSNNSFSFFGWFSDLFGLRKCLKQNSDAKHQKSTQLNPQSLESQQQQSNLQLEEEEQEALEKAEQLKIKGMQCYNENRFDKALEYYTKQLIINEKLKGKESFSCACNLNNIGSVYGKLYRLNQALEYYSRALSIKEKIKGKDSFECADTLNNIGLAYYNQGKVKQAFACYEKALSIYERFKGIHSFQCADTLNNIGTVYARQGKLEQALEYYTRSLTIKQRQKGEESYDCVEALNNIGTVYGKMKKPNQALQYYSKALTIKQRVKGKQSFDCAFTLDNIGVAYGRLERMDQALEYYGRALNIKDRVKGKESIESASTLNSIGCIYKKQAKLNQALQYYGRALTIYQKKGAAKSISSSNILQNIGNIYQILNQHQKASQFQKKSKAIKKDIQMI